VLTSYGELVLDFLFRGVALTPPATWYLGLDISLTGDAYTEPTYTGYARAGVPASTGSWVTAVGHGQSVSALDVTWPAVPSDYVAAEQVRRVFIADSASSSGEHLFDFIDLADVSTLAPDGVPTFAAGTLIINAGNG
jgi:hypothetical protein